MSRYSHVLLSSACARVRGPSYRRGDEPAREVHPARLAAVLSYCRFVDRGETPLECGEVIIDRDRCGKWAAECLGAETLGISG